MMDDTCHHHPVLLEDKITLNLSKSDLYCFQAYLKLLLAANRAGKTSTGSQGMRRVAAKCLCGLLVAVPHFNYSQDLLQAVVPLLAQQQVFYPQSHGADSFCIIL